MDSNHSFSVDTVWCDLCAVREHTPLVHSVTNLVVTAFNANALLAAGASPIMAHAVEEVAELARLSGAVVVNIGTLDAQWVPAMQLASAYRHTVLADLLARRPTLVRGNASEILSLAGHSGQTKGVDSTDPVERAVGAAQTLAQRHGCVVCVSGPEDHVIAPDGRHAVLRNGHPLMTRVTGVGCSASALVGAFAAVQPDAWRACASAMAFWGVAGQLAAERLGPGAGTGSYAVALLDAASTLDHASLARTLRVEQRA